MMLVSGKSFRVLRADPNAAVAFAKEAGFEVSKAEWLKAQASQTLELEELSAVAAGGWFGPIQWLASQGGLANPKPSLPPSLGGAGLPLKRPQNPPLGGR